MQTSPRCLFVIRPPARVLTTRVPSTQEQDGDVNENHPSPQEIATTALACIDSAPGKENQTAGRGSGFRRRLPAPSCGLRRDKSAMP